MLNVYPLTKIHLTAQSKRLLVITTYECCTDNSLYFLLHLLYVIIFESDSGNTQANETLAVCSPIICFVWQTISFELQQNHNRSILPKFSFPILFSLSLI